jgi:hypothetical protein
MLWPQARLAPPGADVDNMNGLPGDGRERKRGSQYLPTTLTQGAIYREHHGSIAIGCK